MRTFQVTYADDPTTVLFEDSNAEPVVAREKARRLAQDWANRHRRACAVQLLGADERFLVEPS